MPKTDVHHTSTPTGGLWGPLKMGCPLPLPRALCRLAGIHYTQTILWVHTSCFRGDCARACGQASCSRFTTPSVTRGYMSAWPRDSGFDWRDVQVLICLSVTQAEWRRELPATSTAATISYSEASGRGDGVRNECSVFTRAKTHTGLFNVPCLAGEMSKKTD